MEEVAESVLAFIRWTDEHPLPPNAPTRVVLNALRTHLDAKVPGWRQRAFENDSSQEAVEIEVHLSGGRIVRGTLLQRPSTVQDGAA
ncbi:hypothetical protein GobsT_65630 [Gemmata obscuriglobus]|uniref:Uncharacterized protein n=1 Tax=Gemmata obscuriglobus TaxID=114 RepID=A0A2Z3H2B8_9BACT|nr:hypothetical protein [Gemmata obscuriglobus]AWM35744.1 hypothetical protein C1280_01035 [Gemmata obscuriglobus]QEG31719.1 hypothetical protein GobsT_65630 [Gemmata obscuriglobus]VTS11065.1 unnamed protein product [Gemmata obscuriglobus UQM 2246]